MTTTMTVQVDIDEKKSCSKNFTLNGKMIVEQYIISEKTHKHCSKLNMMFSIRGGNEPGQAGLCLNRSDLVEKNKA